MRFAVGFLADIVSLLHTCWRKVVQETLRWGRQILLVCMHWSSCLINASYSICSWIHPSKCSLKYRHSHLSHTLGLLLLFACFLKKVHGYLSAKNYNCFLDPGKIGGFTKTSWSGCSMLLQEREEDHQRPSRLHLYSRDYSVPEEGIICCRKICSLS